MVPEGYTEWRHAINNVSLLRASCSEHLKLRGVLKWKRGEWNAPKVTVTNPGAKQDGWRKKKHKHLDWVSKGIVTRIGQLSTIYWGWTELTSIGVHSIWKLNRDLTIARGRMSSVHKPVRTPPPPTYAEDHLGYTFLKWQALHYTWTAQLEDDTTLTKTLSSGKFYVCGCVWRRGFWAFWKTGVGQERPIRRENEVTWVLVQSAWGTHHTRRLEPCGSQRSSTDWLGDWMWD